MKLHLGCGKRYLTGFTHIDIENFKHIDFNSGIENLSFIESEWSILTSNSWSERSLLKSF